MPSESVLKLNCEKCKLRTEHQRLISSIPGKTEYKCLRCGNIREYAQEGEKKNYPVDNSKPAGVG